MSRRENASPTSAPVRPEAEVEEAFDRLVEEGADRLARPMLPLVSTGLLGGIDVGTGVLAYLVVHQRTGSTLLAGLAFSIGFVALLLARSELFTENFLVPVTACVAGRGSWASLLRLWGVTLVANLVGGWVMAWLVVTALPGLAETAVETGTHYATLGSTLSSFSLAVLAGVVITLMGLFGDQATSVNQEPPININLWAGLGLILAAVVFETWKRLRPVKVTEPPPDTDEAPRAAH